RRALAARRPMSRNPDMSAFQTRTACPPFLLGGVSCSPIKADGHPFHIGSAGCPGFWARRHFSSFFVSGEKTTPAHSRVANAAPNVVCVVGGGELLEVGAALAPGPGAAIHPRYLGEASHRGVRTDGS